MSMENFNSVDDIDWKTWQPDERGVVVYIVDKSKNNILLIHKKTGLGAGKINAPGGRIEKGETPMNAVIRECEEEVFLTPLYPQKRAELYFQFKSGYKLYGEIFFAYEWIGKMAETEEAKPFWCSLDEIPWDRMWEDDRHWLPHAIEGKKMRGFYIFDDDDMLSDRTIEVENFDE